MTAGKVIPRCDTNRRTGRRHETQVREKDNERDAVPALADPSWSPLTGGPVQVQSKNGNRWHYSISLHPCHAGVAA